MFRTGIAHKIHHHLLKPARRKIRATGARTIGETIAMMTVPRSQLKRLNEPISGSFIPRAAYRHDALPERGEGRHPPL
jgi:hypothetical protein